MLSFRYILLSGTSLTPPLPTPSLNLNFTTMTALPSTITFSRPSNATYYDSTGKLTYAPNNLLTYSEQFDDGTWSKFNLNISPNSTIAPDGTLTADTYTTIGSGEMGQNFTNAATVIFVSMYVKRILTDYIFLQAVNIVGGGNAVRQFFNISTGVVASVQTFGTGFSKVSASIDDAGNGWYRVSLKVNVPSANAAIVFSTSSTDAPATIIAGQSVFIWGAQAEAVTYQTTPGTYNATTSAVYYGARLDYNPATLAARGLLIEEARTNSFIQSNPNNAYWTTFGNTKTSTATGPDGVSGSACLITNNGTSTTPVLYSSITFSNITPAAESIFVKKNVGNGYILNAFQGNNIYCSAIFDLNGTSDGEASQTSVGSSGGTIVSTRKEYIGNGWFRLSLVGNFASAGSQIRHHGVLDNSSGYTFQAIDGLVLLTSTASAYVFGVQLETGSFATSYIPTAGGTVARSADEASMTGANFSSWYNQTEGTFVPQYDVEGFATNPGVFRASNAGATNYSQTRLTSTTSVGDVVVSSSQASFSFGGAIINALQKFALAYRVNDFAGTLNGATPLTDTSGSAPTDLDRLFLADVGSNVAPLNGHLASFVYYPSRLSDGQLQQLTLSAPPVGNALVWGDGNYLIWDTGNFLTWG